MCEAPLVARNERGDIFFHAKRRGCRRQSEPMRDAKNMRIDCEGGFP
jgi:hypothetical protein